MTALVSVGQTPSNPRRNWFPLQSAMIAISDAKDGSTWKTLDERSGETFTWDRQTRVFSVKSPGTYAKYRLVLTGEATLAEVELLG